MTGPVVRERDQAAAEQTAEAPFGLVHRQLVRQPDQTAAEQSGKAGFDSLVRPLVRQRNHAPGIERG